MNQIKRGAPVFLLNINQKNVSDVIVNSCQKSIKDANLLNVSNDIITRGDHVIEINNSQYDVEEVDTCFDGTILNLYQDTHHRLYLESDSDMHVVCPIKHQTDTNTSVFVFHPKEGKNMTQTEKVVGTSFKEQKHHTDFFNRSETVKNGVTEIIGDAILMPEPDNPYDSYAVMVIAKLKNGKPHHIGYLKSAQKGGILQRKITHPQPAVLHITAYSDNGDFNDSYAVTIETEKGG